MAEGPKQATWCAKDSLIWGVRLDIFDAILAICDMT